MPIPVYSHGGGSQQGFPAVSGTTTGSGNPIQITNTIYEPVMHVFFTGTSCTVFIEGNGGLIDPTTGQPPAAEWVDYTGGAGYGLTNGQTLAKALPKTVPLWRTRISAIVAGTLVSYVPAIVIKDGNLVSAGRPGRGAAIYSPNV
jgi:hypothetical protein